MRYIYVLKDPILREIRYVGQTNSPGRRYSRHISNSIREGSKEYHTYKSRWIRSLIGINQYPLMEIIEECFSYEESNSIEKNYIKECVTKGFRLTNSSSSDTTEFSEETRKKMSESKKGKSLEEIIGKEGAEKCRGKTREMCINNNPNRCWDPKIREKISKSLKKKFENKENHWAFGKKFNEETREKLRTSHLQNPKNIGNRTERSKETKEKLKRSMEGRKIKRSKIVQIDSDMNTVKIWKSLREIEKEEKFNRVQISSCCKSGNKYAGFFWKYE